MQFFISKLVIKIMNVIGGTALPGCSGALRLQ